jgi:hypothetical protein
MKQPWNIAINAKKRDQSKIKFLFIIELIRFFSIPEELHICFPPEVEN